MDNYVFINKGLNDSLLLYLQYKDDDKSLQYNSFWSCIIRMLSLIYDEETIINAYYNKDTKLFNSTLLQYGLPVEELTKFKDNLARCYAFEHGQKDRAIKKKNRYFNFVQKGLIDMLVYKNNQQVVDVDIKKEFYDLLFTANSNDFYRKSYALKLAYNPYEIDDYFKRQGFLVLG